MQISSAERKVFAEAFQFLRIIRDDRITGNLFLDSYYDKVENKIYWNASLAPQISDKQYHVKYAYDIDILLPKNKNDFVVVTETGGKLEKVLKKQKEKNIGFGKEGLHINSNDTLCLCGPKAQENYIRDGLNLKIIMCDLVIPFLYAQRFFELYNEWPWGELPHGEEGKKAELREFDEKETMKEIEKISERLGVNLNFIKEKGYVLDLVKNNQKPKGHHNCICGSELKFKFCHNDLFQKLWSIMDSA